MFGLPVLAWVGIAGLVTILGLGVGLKVEASRLDTAKTELATFKASVDAAEKLHEAEDAKKEAQSKSVIQEKETENAKVALVTAAAWKSYVDGLPKPAGKGGADSRPQPANPIVSVACDDAAQNAVVSAAIQEYQRATRSAVDGFRLKVAEQLAEADKTSAQLSTLQAEVKALAAVNQP